MTLLKGWLEPNGAWRNGNHRLGGDNTRHCRLLPTDTSSVRREVRMGHQRFNLADLARRERATLDLLHTPPRGHVGHRPSRQHCCHRDHPFSRAKEQPDLSTSPG